MTKTQFLAIFVLLIVCGLAPRHAMASPAPLQADALRCEYQEDPAAVDAPRPRLNWQCASAERGQRQSAYQIRVADSPALMDRSRGLLWDSGKIFSDQSVGVAYAGAALRSGQRCWWGVRVWDRNGRPSGWSRTGHWQMGLLHPSDWHARWIGSAAPRLTVLRPSALPGRPVLPPCPYLRRTFSLAGRVRQATLFVTARGLCEMHLNGARVGDAVLSPGWTDYHRRIQYSAYDVTGQVQQGKNALGAVLGDGWYAGYVGFARQRDLYGDKPQLRAQLVVEYADGRRETIGTDGLWRSGFGPVLSSDLLMGEAYDARRERPWDQAGFADAAWRPVAVNPACRQPRTVDVTRQVQAAVQNNALSLTADNALAGDPAYLAIKQLRVFYALGGAARTRTVGEGEPLHLPAPGDPPGPLTVRRAAYGVLSAPNPSPLLVGMHGPPVRVTQHLPARRITMPAPATYVCDLGQNMVGWARLKVQARAGTQIRLRFAEVLNPDGTLYTANLRSARATDTYTCRGGGRPEVWEPRFTFHGFRYVEITGCPGRPGLDMITGCVAGSDTPPAGSLTTSSALVNQLQRNIVWGQRGNFLSVPTDCPQRDERLGWMGDAQIFARTATYNRDVAAFYEKWMDDVCDAQSPAGGFSDVSPRLVDQADGAPAWGDAGVIVPWTVYQAYGDLEIVRRHWQAMTRWMDYITSANSDGLWMHRRGNDFGDWLAISADTPKDLLATAYYAHDADLMAAMARALGRPAEAARYAALRARIGDAFRRAYVSPEGRVQGETQTGYVLALRVGLLLPGQRAEAARHLAENIHARGDHLSTGFVGVGYLCPALTAAGDTDLAYRLLLQDTFPSWGYSVRQGATTIWERWDGHTQERGFQDPGMNSFNHYSLGSVGQWLFQDVAGIDTDPARPGYRHLWLHPHPGPGLSWVRAAFVSPHGPVVSRWQAAADGRLTWDIQIPANTTATVWVPARRRAAVSESGHPLGADPQVCLLRTEPDACVCELGSGTYHFAVSPATSPAGGRTKP